MCGLAGMLGRAAPDEVLSAMAGSLHHRGPDDGGIWSDPEAGIGFAHRRLSIVDLSPLGHQPMASSDGRWMIAYNGEVYNHLDLRRQLGADAPVWRGHSDTETLIECIAHWGLETTLQRSVGMFAVALWDRRERTLSLARDRFGEKPLYYGWAGSDFVFGSELRALRQHPRFDNPVSRAALGALVARSCIGSPLSIYERIFKLVPGTILTVAPDAWRTARDVAPAVGSRTDGITLERYWDYRQVVIDGLADPIADEEAALKALEAALTDAIAGQAVADVPVGAFLSGGIDSSMVVALYQKLKPGKVKTFTIGFDAAAYDEAPFARAFAQHLGTEHHEQLVTARDVQDVIPQLPDIYDEPFADSSQIPTYLVSKLAREKVTVALSGDGGDELFAGYNRYFGTIRLWSQMQRVPAPLRRGFGRGMAAVPPAAWNGLSALLPSGRRPAFFGARVHKVFHTLGNARSLEDFTAMYLDEWSGHGSPVRGGGNPVGTDMQLGAAAPDVVRMMYQDAIDYMPNDILTKVDRAAMAVSLETRVPFLDHRVAAVAARIPVAMKIQGGQGKAILRKLLFRQVPAAMFERPKQGFAVPVGEWLRGPLRDWAESLLDERRLREEGYFDAAVVRRRWESHASGGPDATASLWAILMFQAWLDRQQAEMRTLEPAE